jgi:hypothetical protein
MLKRTLILSVAVLSLCAAVSAQPVHTPEKGSAERKAILDALRAPIERELKQEIVFVAEHFNVAGTWAFIGGVPQATGGGEPNYRGTRYQSARDSDAFDNNFFAILRKTGGRWKVVHYAIGCTDVCYADWSSRYRAPKIIFPYTE